jgi:hypothetical protein
MPLLYPFSEFTYAVYPTVSFKSNIDTESILALLSLGLFKGHYFVHLQENKLETNTYS